MVDCPELFVPVLWFVFNLGMFLSTFHDLWKEATFVRVLDLIVR
jgi:hypothetical protein